MRNPPTRRPSKPKAKSKPHEEPRPVVCDDFQPVLLQRIHGTRPRHHEYLIAMATKTVTFGLGASGTGKSYMATGFAAEALVSGKIDRLILSRPLAQCGGDNLGFLPGPLGDKVGPFMTPVLDALESFLSLSDIEKLLDIGKLRITPLELMRGSSYKNSMIIVDESQNCTRIQLEMALTRIDHGTRIVFTGDEKQSDVGVSPLIGVVKELCKPAILDSMAVIRLTRDDNMRSPVVAQIAERLGI